MAQCFSRKQMDRVSRWDFPTGYFKPAKKAPISRSTSDSFDMKM